MLDSTLIGFSSTHDLLGRLIRWFTGGTVNHAFLLYQSADFNEWMTLGANQNGLEPLPLTEFLKTRTLEYLFAPVGWDLREAMVKHAGDIGRGYDVSGLVGEAWVETWKKITGRYGKNFLDDHKELFCSEWVAEVCATGITSMAFMLDLRLDADQIDPETLKEACLARPRLFRPVAVAEVLS